MIRGSLALPDNKRGSGQALLLKGYTQLPECVHAQCNRLKLQIHASELLQIFRATLRPGILKTCTFHEAAEPALVFGLVAMRTA